METVAVQHPKASARPGLSFTRMLETGLDEEALTQLVHRFYARVRADVILGPVFTARIADWPPHLERMVAFWSSGALMTRQYHGRHVPAHLALPIDAKHSDRWLDLLRASACEACTASGAAHVIQRDKRMPVPCVLPS